MLANARRPQGAAATSPESKADSDVRESLFRAVDPDDLLGLYLAETKKFPLLSAEEEIWLAKQIEAGVLAQQKLDGPNFVEEALRADLRQLVADGDQAMERFLNANLRLVYSIGRRYSRRMEILDVIQEGNLGLVRAVQKFDHRQGFKFSTYATWWIRQAITRAIADQALLIRLPVHVHEKDAPVLAAMRKRRQELGDESAAVCAVATELEMTTAKVENVLRRQRSSR